MVFSENDAIIIIQRKNFRLTFILVSPFFYQERNVENYMCLLYQLVDVILNVSLSQQTAAELVFRRVDAALPLLGMQSFDKKDSKSVKKSDVSIAKNFLNEDEIKLLGLLVEQYLAFAETMAQQRIPMYMTDWIKKLDDILQINGRELLSHAGKISHEKAIQKSQIEFEKYKETQKLIEKEESLKEIEKDIKQLKNNNK